jgi:hypothetical protein
MPMTFLDIAKKLDRVRQELAVWNDICNYLSKGISFETHAAEYKVYTDTLNSASCVPEEVIVDIVNQIDKEEKEPRNKLIEQLQNLTVETTKETEDEPCAKKDEESPDPKAEQKTVEGQKKRVRPVVRNLG